MILLVLFSCKLIYSFLEFANIQKGKINKGMKNGKCYQKYKRNLSQ